MSEPTNSGTTIGGNGCAWSYTGSKGPQFWAELTQNGAPCNNCGAASQQSPINIGAYTQNVNLEQLGFYYAPPSTSVSVVYEHNNFITLYPAPGTAGANYVTYEDPTILPNQAMTYDLLNFHFHCPNEHSVPGMASTVAMELHLVHQATIPVQKTLVVAILMNQVTSGDGCPILEQILGAIDGSPISVYAGSLLPAATSWNQATLQYYTYQGSLTTPPCTSGITWIVLPTTIAVTAAQVQLFQKTLAESEYNGFGSNARPPQNVVSQVQLSPTFGQ